MKTTNVLKWVLYGFLAAIGLLAFYVIGFLVWLPLLIYIVICLVRKKKPSFKMIILTVASLIYFVFTMGSDTSNPNVPVDGSQAIVESSSSEGSSFIESTEVFEESSTIDTTEPIEESCSEETTEENTSIETTEAFEESSTIDTTEEIVETLPVTTEEPTTEESITVAPITQQPTTEAPTTVVPTTQASVTITYILNTNPSSKKFHYVYCSSVNQMKESNKLEFTGTREEAIAMGYSPCGKCKP